MSPFDKARYERLLEGLEITILPCKTAIEADPCGRLDSSFFEKRFVNLRNLAATWDRLETHAKAVVCGPFGSNLLNDNYVDHGIPMIRPFNLRNGRADAGDIALLEEDFVKNSGLKTFPPGTVMFARVGEVAAGVNLYERATISPNIIAVELRDSINPYFVGVFANTRLGQAQLEAGMKVVAQPTISTDSVRSLRIPPLSIGFQKKIAEIYRQAVVVQDQGLHLLKKAETTLLHALGLDTWTPPEALSYVRPSREAFAAGRLDAQFFAPRVEQLLARLGHDGLRLSDVAPARHERFEPTGSGDFDYIEIGSLGADGTATSESVPMAEAPSRATQYVRTGDVITSTVRPIRRLSALVAPEQDGAVCSSGFVVLQPQGISGEVLLTYLRLPLVCELMDLHTSATMYPAISESDLLALPIPAIAPSVQAQVRDAVRQSAHARQRATRLLDAAKRAVEIAIEDSEASALAQLAAANPPDMAT